MDRDSTTVDPTAPDRTDWHSDLNERADTVTTLISTDPEALTDDHVARLVDELTTGTALWGTSVADYLAIVAAERPGLLTDHIGTIAGTATVHDQLLFRIADVLLAVSEAYPQAVSPHLYRFAALTDIDRWTPAHASLSQVFETVATQAGPKDPVEALLDNLVSAPHSREQALTLLTIVVDAMPQYAERYEAVLEDSLTECTGPQRQAWNVVAIASPGRETVPASIVDPITSYAQENQTIPAVSHALETTMWLLIDHHLESAADTLIESSRRWLADDGAAPAGRHAVGCLALVGTEHPAAIPDEYVPAAIDTLELAAERGPRLEAADHELTDWIGIRTHPEGPPTLDRVESALTTLREAAPAAD